MYIHMPQPFYFAFYSLYHVRAPLEPSFMPFNGFYVACIYQYTFLLETAPHVFLHVPYKTLWYWTQIGRFNSSAYKG